MSSPVSVIDPPDVAGKRMAAVLAEDRIGHYAEFRAFFERTFDLPRIGMSRPGYVAAPSGTIYQFVFIGRSGEPFPAGVEINALVDDLEPLDDALVDTDLWAILRWMISGVGAPWSVQDLDATGRLYRLAAAADPKG
jgi:hypothetical protein